MTVVDLVLQMYVIYFSVMNKKFAIFALNKK